MESNESDSVNFLIPKPMQKTSTLMKQIDGWGGGGSWFYFKIRS